MLRISKLSKLPLLFASLLVVAPASAQSFGTFEIKAKTGDPIPNTSQTLRISTLNQPDISQGGVVAFFGTSQQTTNITALFSLSGSNQSALGRHISQEQSTPTSDGRIQSIGEIYRMDSGVLYARTFLQNVTSGGPNALYRTTTTQTLTEVLRAGKQFASGFPTICSVNGLFARVHMERNEDIWFAPLTQSAPNANCERRAIYRMTASGTVTTRATLGASISGTAATLTDILGEVIGNDAGQIFFRGRDSASSGIFWYLIRGNSVLRIAPTVNGEVHASANETLSFVENSKITQFRGGSMSGVEVIRQGQNLPQGQGQFFQVRNADIARDNVIVATMVLTGTAGGSSDDSGVYLVDDQGIVEVAREGRPAVAPNSTFRSFPDFTEFATVGLGGRVLFEARYQIGNETRRGWFFYSRSTGIREILNTSMSISGLQVRDWNVGPRFNQRGELPMVLTLSDNLNYMAIYRLPGAFIPPPPPSFSIVPGITGAWFDPQQSGHGLFVEVLPENRLLAWWFTFDAEGNQAWFGGVGTYAGDVATIPFAKTAGGRFIPNFNPSLVTNPPWGTATIRFTGCNRGRIDYTSSLSGFGTGSMELTRLTLPAGLTCNP